MTAALVRVGEIGLSVGDPPIYRAPFGSSVLVDFGDVTPVPFATFEAAVAEIKVRKDVPPVGALRSTRTSVVATAGGAGADRPRWCSAAVQEDAPVAVPSNPTVSAPPAAGGLVPGPPAYASPGEEDGSGTSKSLRGREGEVGVSAVAVGAPTEGAEVSV